ncbi:MAG: cysteine synthase A [Pseudomonadales bacterium]
MVANSLLDLIGNTPLLKLKSVSELTGCDIYGKCEFLNPGGSVKDRTALGIIRKAEERGELQPGGTIVEGTAGNTGIGLCILGNALGYKIRIVMPMNQSREKIEQLELLGADLHLVQVTGYDDDKHYVHQARRMAEKMNAKEPGSAFWSRQFDNTDNRRIHCETTGQEIWVQTEGQVDGFICSVGTGGTLAGVSDALKDKNPNIKIGLADPDGSALYSYFTSGEFKSEGNSVAEGIGISHLTQNLDGAKVDMAFRISDHEALPYIFSLLTDEGICLGGSSAINIAGAVALARELGPGHKIVTVLCDYGTRYQSKIYNPTFLKAKNLPVPGWLR